MTVPRVATPSTAIVDDAGCMDPGTVSKGVSPPVLFTKIVSGSLDNVQEAPGRQVGAPLIYTSVILAAGFGSLTRSEFVLNSDLGIYCTLIIILALFADFILLPAVILKFDKDKPENETNAVVPELAAKEA